MNTPNPSESALDSAVETVSTIPIVRKLFGYEKEDIDTVLAALASAQRDGKRLDWLQDNWGQEPVITLNVFPNVSQETIAALHACAELAALATQPATNFAPTSLTHPACSERGKPVEPDGEHQSNVKAMSDKLAYAHITKQVNDELLFVAQYGRAFGFSFLLPGEATPEIIANMLIRSAQGLLKLAQADEKKEP